MFRESLLDPERGYNGERVEGLDFYVEHLPWKKLPREVFEVYGGFEEAKRIRKELKKGQTTEKVQLSTEASNKASSSTVRKEERTVSDQAETKVAPSLGKIGKAESAMPLQLLKQKVELTSSSSTTAAIKRKFSEAVTSAMEESMGPKTRFGRRAVVINEVKKAPVAFNIPHLNWILTEK